MLRFRKLFRSSPQDRADAVFTPSPPSRAVQRNIMGVLQVSCGRRLPAAIQNFQSLHHECDRSRQIRIRSAHASRSKRFNAISRALLCSFRRRTGSPTAPHMTPNISCKTAIIETI